MRKRTILTVMLLATSCVFAQKGGGKGSGGGAPSGSTGTARPGSAPVYRGAPMGYPNYGPYSPYGRFNLPPGSVYDVTTGTVRPLSPQEERLQRMMEKQRNLQRQKNMLADTDKLTDLANTVQRDVESADGKLSSDAIKRAGEVEKLAKSVERKMRGDN